MIGGHLARSCGNQFEGDGGQHMSQSKSDMSGRCIWTQGYSAPHLRPEPFISSSFFWSHLRHPNKQKSVKLTLQGTNVTTIALRNGVPEGRIQRQLIQSRIFLPSHIPFICGQQYWTVLACNNILHGYSTTVSSIFFQMIYVPGFMKRKYSFVSNITPIKYSNVSFCCLLNFLFKW